MLSGCSFFRPDNYEADDSGACICISSSVLGCSLTVQSLAIICVTVIFGTCVSILMVFKVTIVDHRGAASHV